MPRRRRYDHDYFRDPFPTPWGGFYPPTSAGGGMLYGLEGGGWAPDYPLGEAYHDDYARGPRPYHTRPRGWHRTAARGTLRGERAWGEFEPRRRGEYRRGVPERAWRRARARGEVEPSRRRAVGERRLWWRHERPRRSEWW